MFQTIRRELRVAFSKNAQPIWFRVAKWIVFLTGFGYLWHAKRARFWSWLAGAAFAGVIVHGFWRWQTHGWTRPWGGWNDVATAGK